MPSSESAMLPNAELANITLIAFIPVRITTLNSAGSLMPSIWVTVAEMPAVLTAALLVRKAIAKHTAAFAKPQHRFMNFFIFMLQAPKKRSESNHQMPPFLFLQIFLNILKDRLRRRRSRHRFARSHSWRCWMPGRHRHAPVRPAVPPFPTRFSVRIPAKRLRVAHDPTATASRLAQAPRRSHGCLSWQIASPN